ncbi:ParB/RepB/Spo0J family partition protein [Thalassococcus lentus]|uniref:ParB/RepB/Spo0J family partition protein n=1 Tax=Thalassococcus lentus TaxID=1210524 RepID=A0ABT4XXL5_9RHOB|nr:ParB/RepB/Spo0J family partition protein [Thalassococcus lentus]MDA7426691.1 ParB/RepB/Spo0J family partition protein [Thalassococcus lentus]
MSRKHDAIFDDVLSDLDAPAPQREDRAGARFLKRSTSIADRLSGDLEEKTLRWVDPAECKLWERHNREYSLLNEDNCRDLIDGIRSQGRQEFPAIVRATGDSDQPYEVICGARRHFAVSWLRANNYTQFKYLIDVRDLTDEEAFRLADIENRDREDISDYERAVDYADAIERYYGGKQKSMAERLEVSQPWLSRYLQLAKLPDIIVQAFASIRDLRERNARDLKPLLGDPKASAAILEEAGSLAREQERARQGRGAFVEPQAVMRRLLQAGKPAKPKAAKDPGTLYRRSAGERGITVHKKGRKVTMEFEENLTRASLEAAFQSYLNARFKKE